MNGDRFSAWQRWLRHPQATTLRKAVFQVHLWSGIGLGLYVIMISVTGSVLVYRNELNVAATPAPIVSTGSGPRLNDADLAAAALHLYPDYRIERLSRARNLDQAVGVWLRRGADSKVRLFDPRSGNDVGPWTPIGILLIDELASLHDDLFAGPVGRKVNGIGAAAVVLLALTGLTIWWPGIQRWRRSLVVRGGVGWKRFVWDLHGVIGFWSFAFILVFGLSGIYLCVPDSIQAFADWLEPPTDENAGRRFVDDAIYWLAYLHFGRINGIGIPCAGPGVCDQTTKAVWALFGLAPAATFVTGTIMWWNRVLRPWLRSAEPASANQSS
jgi:uncharacterized iron-regulated membrane protein